MKLAAVLAVISFSDLMALGCAACGLYGLALLHPAAPWLGASVALGFVAVEIGKREAAGSRKDTD
jgi:hypothetical protein